MQQPQSLSYGELNQLVSYGEHPQNIVCPQCRARVITVTKKKIGTGAWCCCIILCASLVWCGCQFLPFCLDTFKDVEHYCSSCNNLVGKFARMKT
jgi:lipopolysaccharide-induced tumor necrosis factor-alpha factor